MKYNYLKKLLQKKEKKTEFAIITNLKNGESVFLKKTNL